MLSSSTLVPPAMGNRDFRPQSGPSDLAELSIHTEVDALLAEWRSFEVGACSTLYQSARWIGAWCRHVASRRNEQPLIVVGRSPTGALRFILPFAVTRRHGVGVLGFLGQEHAGYGMGLYAPGEMTRLGPAGARAIIADLARKVPGLAVARLLSQPAEWDGEVNPFAQIAARLAPSRSHVLRLEPDFARLYDAAVSGHSRSVLKRKEKKLAATGSFRIVRTQTVGERLAALGAFEAQRAHQFAAAGIANPFADRAIAAFYRDLAGVNAVDPPVLESVVALAGDATIATTNGIRHRDRFYFLTASLGQHELTKFSPGVVAMKELVRSLCAEQTQSFDFGAGEGAHKAMWSPAALTLTDTHLALGALGHIVGLAERSGRAAKRFVKERPQLFSVAKKLRRTLFGAAGRTA